MLLEDCHGSTRPVAVAEPHFSVFPEFRGVSYSGRYELLLRKLVHEKLYDAAAFLTSTEKGGSRGQFIEPAEDLTMRRLLAGFAGHVAGYLAAIK
jgi:type II restriction enzyme